MVVLYAKVDYTASAAETSWLGSAGATNSGGLQRFLKNHRLANFNGEDHIFIRWACIRDGLKMVVYTYKLQINEAVPDSLSDMYTTVYSAWCSAMSWGPTLGPPKISAGNIISTHHHGWCFSLGKWIVTRVI